MYLKELNYKILYNPTQDVPILSSLIICTYKRSLEIVKLIKHLVTLNDLPSEILIIDGSNDTDTLKELDNFFLHNENKINSKIIYIIAPTGLTIQRNAGIDISKGEIIHFLDDDCFPEQDYFYEIEKLFDSDNKIGGVTANILNERSSKLSLKNKIRFWIGIYSKKHTPGIYYCNGSSIPPETKAILTEDYEVNILSGACMSFRKKTLNEAGDFSEFFSGYAQGEDLEASLRVNKISKLMIAHKAKCNHYHVNVSRPNLFKKGYMEVYNKYYIWKNNTPNKKIICYVQFWGDVLFLYFYSLMLFLKSGFNLKYIKYFKGFLKGTYDALTKKAVEKPRTVRFILKN